MGVRLVPFCCWLLLLLLARRPAAVDGQCQGRCNTTCATLVIADAARGTDCGSASDLAGMTCDSLQHVLKSIERGSTVAEPGDCVEVYVAAGRYTLTSPVVITRSVVLRGEYNSSAITAGANFPSSRSGSSVFGVTIGFDGFGGRGKQALFALAFKSAERVEMTGLGFAGSPGIVGFDEIAMVIIKDCSFR